MKICILTQTSEDISDYYKEFFKDYDFYFITYKKKNNNAIDFLPNSTWSSGRNRLWQHVKGKYDYYLFIDDDLIFNKSKISTHPYFYLLYKKLLFKKTIDCYKPCNSLYFFSKLNSVVSLHKPEILSVRNLNNLNNEVIDNSAMKNKTFIRRLGWFDAQFTLFSDYAAHRLLPYDTAVSGWASAQILIYLISYHVFKDKAITLNNIAVNNSYHTGAYVPSYSSNLDCKNMIDLICKHTKKDYKSLFDIKTNHVNLFYGYDSSMKSNCNDFSNYQRNFDCSLKGIDALMLDNNLDFS